MITTDSALIGTTIHRVAKLIQRRIDEEVRDIGLTRLSWMAASQVGAASGLTIGELANQLEVGAASAGQLVDRMTREGWVERNNAPGDRRAVIVTLTPKAKAALSQLDPRQETLEQDILQDLSAEERAVLLSLLERILHRLSR
ncbi:MarR family winged helix-turn-helix transcriptional regulator [Erythrobacter tepidarius]|uniref:MarR family winged helix-turn-helix transcriptional regulator n=1 Tax=Erythrobacter tepidarius TaxID=60454 RepID=UPI000A35DEDB|nr:MarR family transcriptional regulator [Erythrobacter tepidarius]